MTTKLSNNNKFVKLWTPQMKRRVELLFYNGASIVEVCREIGIVKKTFYNWEKAYPDFKDVVAHGMIARLYMHDNFKNTNCMFVRDTDSIISETIFL